MSTRHRWKRAPAAALPPLASVDTDQVASRLKEAVKESAERNGANTVEAQASWLGVTKKTLERWLRGDNGPSMKQLFAIGQRTGVSVDWLLGFTDIEQSRDARATIGALSSELETLMEKRYPAGAFAPELREGGGSQLANTLVDSFWEGQLRARASEAATKFLELTYAIQREGQLIADPLARKELHGVVGQTRMIVVKLESPSVTWADVGSHRFAFPARQFTISRGLSTTFDVVDGWGFLWRDAGYDLAIYIEPGKKWGELGDIKVRRERRPFLVEQALDLTEESGVESNPRATPVPPQPKAPRRNAPGRSHK